jgi:DNA-binding CsgD family transcriptional regulator
VDFSDAERDLIEFVKPHIAQMYRGAEMFSLLGRATPADGVRTIMLDKDGSPLLATQAAWDLLATYFPGRSTRARDFPVPVGSWLQAQLTGLDRASKLPLPGAPLVVLKDGHGRLTLTLMFGERTGEQALLVLEERRESGPATVSPHFGLSLREEEILSLLRVGKSSREIADGLFVSRRTVEKHLENIYCKLGVENRTAAVMVAYSGDQER